MRFVYPDIACEFETGQRKINTLIIENQSLFYRLITDIQNQLSGLEGRAVLSRDNKILSLDKKVELLDRFIPFDLNTKALITKITADLEKKAISDENYADTNTLVCDIERFLTNLAFDYPCDIEFSKIGIGSVIKASGIEICDDYTELGEKILDYFQLVNDLLGEKLFITVNLRCYMTDDQTKNFMQTVASHQYDVIMIEGFEHTKLEEEKRLIIDADLCLIG